MGEVRRELVGAAAAIDCPPRVGAIPLEGHGAAGVDLDQDELVGRVLLLPPDEPRVEALDAKDDPALFRLDRLDLVEVNAVTANLAERPEQHPAAERIPVLLDDVVPHAFDPCSHEPGEIGGLGAPERHLRERAHRPGVSAPSTPAAASP